MMVMNELIVWYRGGGGVSEGGSDKQKIELLISLWNTGKRRIDQLLDNSR